MRILVLDMKNHVTENISRYQGTCIGYLEHPFEKESPWAFTARFFLVVQWNSATDGGGKSFSSTRENTEVWAANHQGRHAQAA